MKRYAASYVYISPGQVCKQYVVELEREKAVRLFPLKEEIESTVWLDGVIVLSPFAGYALKEGTVFQDILNDLCSPKADAVYVYHLSGIELPTYKLLPSAKLTRL